MKRYYCSLAIIVSLLFSVQGWGQLLYPEQRSDPSLLSTGIHSGNRVKISFQNDGGLAGLNSGVAIRGEWPNGSGYDYIGDVTPLIGVEFFNTLNDTLHSVTISRGPRSNQDSKQAPGGDRHFWGWDPRPGFLNPKVQSVAMSQIDSSWPPQGWADHPDWKDTNGVTQWDGYFGRGIMNADQESYFVDDDQHYDAYNGYFNPDSTDPTRKGMGLRMAVRGFQWSSFLAQDCIFWLYDISNEATTTFRKAAFGMVVGTLVGGDGDSQDDLGFFDVNDNITYSWDGDGIGNHGQKTGYVGYAFLESPGNPYDGIDNDGDSPDPTSPVFTASDFDAVRYNVGDQVVLIDPATYVRSLHTVKGPIDTVYSMGVRFIIVPGVTQFREGNIASVQNGISIPDPTAYDGIDNNLNGLIDENQAVDVDARTRRGLPALKHKNYVTGAGVNDPLIDERRDNDAGQLIVSWVRKPDGSVVQIQHWSGDENGNWDPAVDDVGSDGVGPNDDNYFGPDADGTEGNGRPDQGEPDFGKTDPNESDQIGLTSFDFFNVNAQPPMNNDEILWAGMNPGKFDVVPSQPQDGDFIYGSGYFPLLPKTTERFSVALVFGVDYADIKRNKNIVQQIYNAGYKFPQPPRKPKIKLTQKDGRVVIYWDGGPTENSRDFITKKKDFEGYKIYRATDAGFQDSRSITDAYGVLKFDKPIAQFDLNDTSSGFFYPSASLLDEVGGTTFYLGTNSGIVNQFIDSTVTEGQRYFYAVCAYDHGEVGLNIFPSENSKFVLQMSTGQIVTDDNTGYITPGVSPVGYVAASPSVFTKSSTFRGTGSATVEVIDETVIKNGNKYAIVFQDSGLQHYTKNWSLVDLSSPDTVVIGTSGESKLVRPGETVSVPLNKNITVNGFTYRSPAKTYTAGYDTLISHDTTFNNDNLKVIDGFKVEIQNDDKILFDTSKSGWDITPSTDFQSYTVNVFHWANTGSGVADNGVASASEYQIEFHNTVVDTSVGDTLIPPIPANRIPASPVKFRVKNLTTGQYIKFVYVKNQTENTLSYVIYFKELLGDGKIHRTWDVALFYTHSYDSLETTGNLTLAFKIPFSTFDTYTFTMNGSHINAPAAAKNLSSIRVVPNPYIVTHELEPHLLPNQSSGRGERFVRFTHVPPGANISIFTVRGDLVRKLHQDNLYDGDVKWDLRTAENLDVAYGVYVYVVETANSGSTTGKLALIK